jgi:hypothetical protein
LGESSADVFVDKASFGDASCADRERKINSKSRPHRKNERMEFFPGLLLR